jgi:hypothetical protein
MVINLSKLSGSEFAELANELSLHGSLRDVLSWAGTKPKSEIASQIVAEVITQDEFTHDVIVPYREVFLVYDTT